VTNKGNNIASADAWRSASHAVRLESAERLRLPSGATILAARPEPLEWILAGRLPQRLLGVALEGHPPTEEHEVSREEILELARFATQLVKSTIVEPRIGEGEGEIALEEIPIQDRAFIFEWACRAWSDGGAPAHPTKDGHAAQDGARPGLQHSNEEDQSIPSNGIERFRQK
jgi:hypothetical protein